MSESKTSRIELRLETSLLTEIDSLLDGRSRSEWIRRACKTYVTICSLTDKGKVTDNEPTWDNL